MIGLSIRSLKEIAPSRSSLPVSISSYTVVSKRKLIELVEKKYVTGWDDPRMPTVAGMRHRGYTPEAIRNFCATIGVAKNENLVDMALLESCVRDDLNERAPRAMAVLRPLRVIIDNYPEGQTENWSVPIIRKTPIWEHGRSPFPGYFTLNRKTSRKIRRRNINVSLRDARYGLRSSYVIKFASMVKDEKTGEITELHCTYDPETRKCSTCRWPQGRRRHPLGLC